MRTILATIAAAVVALVLSPDAAASPYLDRHQLRAVNQFGPGFCAALDQNPNVLTVHNFTQSLIGLTLDDGWYFLEDEAKQVTSASINAYCPQHQGLYLGTEFGKGFLEGFLGG